MSGFVIRAIEFFLRARHGDAVWMTASAAAALRPGAVGIMHHYPAGLAGELIRAASRSLHIGREELLDDLGGWLARAPALRDVMRFSGTSFGDFVLSLDDLQNRAHVVLPGLDLPRLDAQPAGPDRYLLSVTAADDDWFALLAGFLRGMADDYGVLAVVERRETVLEVHIADARFAAGRRFALHQQAGAPA
ncbi:MAG: heme NO-binding domain-containing protein [Paracoccus sp. (in: a-proteobacteria)]|nr:heme NO-binding domain-containing protein [Paracoccus sp. (in: a-proteobacteria)]